MRVWRFWLKVIKISSLYMALIFGWVQLTDLVQWGLTHRLFVDPIDNFSTKLFLVYLVPWALFMIYLAVSGIDWSWPEKEK